MTAPLLKPMSIEAFLAFAQAQERGRFELWGGEVVAMAPERAEHVRAKASIWRGLQAAIERQGLPCEAFVDGLSVVIDANTVYEPDVLINRGVAVADESLLAPFPIVIVEVVSPSSGNRDRSLKLEGYFRVASVAHYLVVDLSNRLVLHYSRDGDARIALSIVRDGVLKLDPPGLDLSWSEIFKQLA